MFPVVAVKIREMHLFAFCRHFCHRVLLHAQCPDAYAVRHTPAECIEKWIICNFVFSHSRRMLKEKKAIYICFLSVVHSHLVFSGSHREPRLNQNAALPSHRWLSWSCRFCVVRPCVCACVAVVLLFWEKEKMIWFFPYCKLQRKRFEDFSLVSNHFLFSSSTFLFVCEVRTKDIYKN